MQKSLGLFLALATLSAAQAQSADPASQGSTSTPPTATQPAPVVQAYPTDQASSPVGTEAAPMQAAPPVNGSYGADPNQTSARMSRQIFDAEPNAGVYVRYDVNQGVTTVSATGGVTEIRVLKGRADVTVHHAADHSQVLVDLPRGQVSLLKDGLYTFNAATDTVRVLHGEAEAFAGERTATVKGTKVKEYQQLTLVSDAKLKAVDSYRFELTADLLPGGGNHGDGGGYGAGFYGGYPYYAGFYGYPGYGFYPYGYGYPFGVGLGFGYFGGFRR